MYMLTVLELLYLRPQAINKNNAPISLLLHTVVPTSGSPLLSVKLLLAITIRSIHAPIPNNPPVNKYNMPFHTRSV